MKTIFTLIAIVLVIAGIVAGLYAYYGGFKKVEFEITQSGGEILVYKSVTGDYSQTGKVSDEIYYQLIDDYKIETTKGFGIYYDNPREVAKEELRSDVGVILPEQHSDKKEMLESEFKVEIFPAGDFVVTEFPYKGQLSVMIGVIRVYPALERFVKDNNLNPATPVMEIYDIPNKKITYRKEVVRN